MCFWLWICITYSSKSSDGSVYHGETFLIYQGFNLQILIDGNDSIYWVEFSDEDLNSTKPFTKAVNNGIQLAI